VAKGHGRRQRRRLTSTTALNDYLDGPDVGQVFELERVRTCGGQARVEVVYGITSLGHGQADAKRFLGLVRGHGGIENKLHDVKDVTLGEDRCRARTGSAPEVWALRRDVVVHLLQGVKAASKAAALRRFAARPLEALALLFRRDN
jgi:hypothetical protein